MDTKYDKTCYQLHLVSFCGLHVLFILLGYIKKEIRNRLSYIKYAYIYNDVNIKSPEYYTKIY